MKPLRFVPLIKQIRWGGTRLGSVLGKEIGAATDCAESWEIVDHGADQSRVSKGPYAGWTLERLVRERGNELLGRHGGVTQFPLLIKFLDAHDRLSVQVHPNDEQARVYDVRENGKTEAWVIIDAEPAAQIFVGLKAGVDRARLQAALARGAIEECLHAVPAVAGDCHFVPAGTVHAIGEGVLLAEVQQSSDITFRLDDWGRLGPDGKPRMLHVDQALECIDFSRGPLRPVKPLRVGVGDSACEELVRCDYFVIRRHQGSGSFSLGDAEACRIAMVLRGDARLSSEGEDELIRRGETILLPAGAFSTIAPRPEVEILEVFLP